MINPLIDTVLLIGSICGLCWLLIKAWHYVFFHFLYSGSRLGSLEFI